MRSFFWTNNMAELVKFYENTMTGVPQLANVQGSMINLLDSILVNGFNEKVITSIIRDGQTALISFNSPHGYSGRQVILIAGSTNGWNGEYRIISLTPTTLTVECSEALPSDSTGTASCKAAPMGFEILFTGTNKRAYRSLNPESLGLILRVVDEPSPTPIGAKYAKVGVTNSMSDIDTITGVQIPYDSSNPNANWSGIGWAKWYYALYNPSSFEPNQPRDFNRNFTIVGDSKGFIQFVESDTQQPMFFGFAEYFDEVIQANNLCFIASGLITKILDNSNAGAFSPIKYLIYNDGYSGSAQPQAYCWFNNSGNIEKQPITIHPQLGGGSPSNVATVFSTTFACIPFILISNQKVLGHLPFLKIQLSSLNGIGFNAYGGYKAYYLATTYHVYKFALTLETR